MNLPKKAIPFVILILSILVFTIIYCRMEGWKVENGQTKQKRLAVTDSLWYSISTQSLLGLGDITPTTSAGKIASAIQVLVTICLVFLTFIIVDV